MKSEMITLKHGDTTIKMPASSLAQLALASTFALVLPPAANIQPITVHEVPAIGEYWPGQGGINGGLVAEHGGVPAHYLIISKDDIGNFEWGPRATESVATSKTDGRANTAILSGSKENYPAAKACFTYQADGHADFYLPAAAELYHCWVNVPDLFAKDCYYWSSTQRSADYAFFMHFVGGFQGNFCKLNELRVRPVRRFFI
ncbi:DUF1566 domain-containing protein [Pseudomonas sp. 681]|uniref:DUF1566 domain-containing protein n=1 Tax=Pseudomonas fungipugnans TaxID=3024217 RepID=A0ABT6QW84_9PSED|nr:DUF1566 domain-containing protein [Pseudomonas sp. 681]MDI2594990.1 DUF1566 domain-containing protein [Pseudomonas sp. 681]